VLRWALPTSNMESSLFQMDRTLRSCGASQDHVELEKRLVGWKIESPANQWVKAATNLFTCVAVPRFPEYDIERFRDTMDNILEEHRWQNPREYAVDKLETVAFYREPLGAFRYVLPEFNDEVGHKALLDHWASLVVPQNIILAGVNVDVEELAAAYENAPFPHSDTAPHHAAVKRELVSGAHEATQWVGANEAHEQESRAKAMGVHPEMEEETIIALGYRTFGRDQSTKEYAVALVMQQLINVASEDGLRVTRHAVHQGLRSFYRPYASAGMIGITVRDSPYDALSGLKAGAMLVDALPVSDAKAVAAAAQRAKVAFYHGSLELNRDYLDFLATSFGAQGLGYTEVAAIATAIDAVKPADLKKALEQMKEAKPCLFATGATYKLPSLRQLGL